MILYLSADQLGKDTLVLEKKVGRPTTNSPSRRVHQTVLILTYHQCPSEIAAFKRDCGWRLYATNTLPRHSTSTERLVSCQILIRLLTLSSHPR